MKDSYYFSHDSNARTDERILAVRAKYGAKGYGIYFMIIEMLREANAYQMLKQCSSIAYELHESVEEVQDVIENFGLFEFCEDYFFSPSLKKRMDRKNEMVEKRRQAGKKGGQASAQAKLKQTSTIAQPLKERKGKESKGKQHKPKDGVVVSELKKQAAELSRYMLEAILINNPGFKHNETTIERWAVDIDLMLRHDQRSFDDAKQVIDFAQKSTFWRANILSGSKLREQFDQLWLQKDRPQAGMKQIFSSTLAKQQS